MALRPLRIAVRLVGTFTITMGVLGGPQGAAFARWIRRKVESATRALRLQFGPGQRPYTWGRLAQRNQTCTEQAFHNTAFREVALMACTPDCIWPSPSQAHCGTCHNTFSGVSLFDAHRIGGTCHPPTAIPTSVRALQAGGPTVPTRQDARGVWRYDIPRHRIPKGDADAAQNAENTEPGSRPPDAV